MIMTVGIGMMGATTMDGWMMDDVIFNSSIYWTCIAIAVCI
jgi:hypothetical protein